VIITTGRIRRTSHHQINLLGATQSVESKRALLGICCLPAMIATGFPKSNQDKLIYKINLERRDCLLHQAHRRVQIQIGKLLSVVVEFELDSSCPSQANQSEGAW
jgi:hypothetical protein